MQQKHTDNELWELIGIPKDTKLNTINTFDLSDTWYYVVALFTSEKAAEDYAAQSKLDAYGIKFKPGSLLANCKLYAIRKHEPLNVPTDPEWPS